MTGYGHRALQLHRQPRRRPHHPVRQPARVLALGALWLTLVEPPGARCPGRRPPGRARERAWASRRCSWRRHGRPPRSATPSRRWRTSCPGDNRWRPPASGCGTRRPSGPRRPRASGPARRAPARRGAQHRAHQRRPLGRDPDASRARQRGPARRSLGGQLRPRAAPRAAAGVRGRPRTAASGCSSTPRPAEPSTATAREPDLDPLAELRSGAHRARRAWPRCRSGC